MPYLSLTEVPEGGECCCAMPDHEDSDHVATLIRALPTENADPDWAAALGAARPRWAAWLKDAKLGAKGRLATALQPDDVRSSTAAELAKELAR